MNDDVPLAHSAKKDEEISSQTYAEHIAGAPPIGFVVQETYWAYAIANPLGNVIFHKIDIIYKGTPSTPSNAYVDSMYITQFVDPDLGYYGDDFVGSDTLLNMNYSYNATAHDAIFSAMGMAPPAVGYDFFQGVSYRTNNPADSAVFNLKWRHGRKYVWPRPMTGAGYFASGGTWSDPALQNYNGSLEWYNMMRGYLPRPPYPAAKPFPRPDAYGGPIGGFGTFLVPGNPVTGTGWIDGSVDGPSDRRMYLITGPFKMSVGDTAEVVLGLVGGIGNSNISSVSVLKFNDIFAQFAYNNLFNLPIYPSPVVQVAELNQKVILNWGNDSKSVDAIENSFHKGYKFQGYNVYQMPTESSSLKNAVRIATYDVKDNVTIILDKVIDPSTGSVLEKPVEFGKNTGIKRFIVINKDYVRSQPLRNGQQYYFAVTAYGYDPAVDVPFHALESAPIILTVTPHSPNPGVRYAGISGDTVEVTHTSSGRKSDGKVIPIIVDPTRTTGDNYKVTFDTLGGKTVWNLTDVTTKKVILANQTNQSGNGNYPIINGVLTKVSGPPIGINHWSYSGDRWVSGVDWGGAQFFGGMDIGANFFGSDVKPTDYVPVEMKWTGGAGKSTPSVANGWAQGAVYWRSDHYNYHGIGWMPFTSWNVSDPANPIQLNASFVEDAKAGSANMKWDMGWNGTKFSSLGGREYIFLSDTPYDPTHYNGTITGYDHDVLYAIWPSARGTHTYLEAPFTMNIVPNYPNTLLDVFNFSEPGKTQNSALAKADITKINVFPNPYYGYQDREISRMTHYVTFNHLPVQSAWTIRIFDLAGNLVKTIRRGNGNSQFTTWNLTNKNNYPVASGIYIAYIDMPGLGTKVLKLAIVQERQILNVY